MSRRHINWPEKLNEAIDRKRLEPFAWGVNDCCIFACDVILDLTGMDPAHDLRGSYASRLTATRLLKPLGGVEGVAVARCIEHGFAELKATAFAQRGDVVLMDTDRDGPTLGICVGARAAFIASEGLTFFPMAKCRRAWRVD